MSNSTHTDIVQQKTYKLRWKTIWKHL